MAMGANSVWGLHYPSPSLFPVLVVRRHVALTCPIFHSRLRGHVRSLLIPIRYQKKRKKKPNTMNTLTNTCNSFPFTVLVSTRSSSRRQKQSVLCCRSKEGDGHQFVLHDSLDNSGIDTTHARAAREGFISQIGRLSRIGRDTSIAINRWIDLARIALQIAAEDDSLVSHSSVPLPVDSFIDRLDDLSMGFCSLYMPPARSPPEVFLGNLERYLYVHKGFRRTDVIKQSDARALYLHSVLTCRSGSKVMLAIVYSELLKMLRICSFLNFDVEIYFPHDDASLPRGYHKQKSKLSDQPHIMTIHALLVEILRDLKVFFWPFQYDHSSSLFIKAAHAANCVGGQSVVGERSSKSYHNVSGFEIASAKAAQHRLGRGVWTDVNFGDIRRALAACERLILLETDSLELRDYGALLYHCGYYKESLHYLNLYKSSRMASPSSPVEKLEEDALHKLVLRLNLIMMEKGWSRSAVSTNLWRNNSEPW